MPIVFWPLSTLLYARILFLACLHLIYGTAVLSEIHKLKLDFINYIGILIDYIPGGPPINGTVDFSGFCSDKQLCFFTLLDRATFPHYNNTKIIKFGLKLFILWVISYGLSFSRFARFPEFRGTINDSFGRP